MRLGPAGARLALNGKYERYQPLPKRARMVHKKDTGDIIGTNGT